MNTLGVYIHIPFCRAKCNYCAFVSQVCDETVQRSYVAALCGEISAAGGDFSVPVDTVFFGGGTPTVLNPADLAVILQTVRTSFSVAEGAEISLEANPGTAGLDSLRQLRQAGFNRVSFGVQSFDDAVLTGIGRIHRADDAERAIAEARTAGFENISLDLMYGLPLQTFSSWEKTMQRAVALAPRHISAYGLKVEEGTLLEKMLATGQSALPPEEEEEAMYDRLNEFLPAQGFARYEISNFAPAGYECRHNLKYWNYQPYRGFGVAAHSFDGRERFANTEKIAYYVTQQATGGITEDFRETLSEATAMSEYVFLSLRTTQGLSGPAFTNRFGQDFLKIYAEEVARLINIGLLEEKNEGWRLTERGMKLGNQAFAEFLP